MRKTLALAACAAMAVPAAAWADGKLFLYNWGGYTSPEMLAKFEEETGITVTVTDFDSTDTALARVRQGGHGFDAVIVSSSALPVWVEEGLLQPLDDTIVTDRSNIDERWQDVAFDPGREHTVPWLWGTTGIVVDTAVYDGDINTADVIFDTPEELVGRINVIPEMSDVMAMAIYYVGGDDPCTSDRDTLVKVRDALQAAKPNWAALDYGSMDSYAAGDLAGGIYWNGAALELRGRKDSYAYGYPSSGYPVWMDSIGVLADATNRDNAMTFINFLLQPENAAMNSNFAHYANGITGSEAFLKEEILNAPEIIAPDNLAAAGRFTPTCSQDAKDIHTRIWTELLQ